MLFSHRTLILFCASDFNCHLTLSNQNQIFLYTRCITLNHVTSLRGPSSRHCARATLLFSKKCCSSGEPLATLSDLTGPKIELPLPRRTRYCSTFQVKLQLYYKQICNASFLFFQMTYSSNDLEMNPRV